MALKGNELSVTRGIQEETGQPLDKVSAHQMGKKKESSEDLSNTDIGRF